PMSFSFPWSCCPLGSDTCWRTPLPERIALAIRRAAWSECRPPSGSACSRVEYSARQRSQQAKWMPSLQVELGRTFSGQLQYFLPAVSGYPPSLRQASEPPQQPELVPGGKCS